MFRKLLTIAFLGVLLIAIATPRETQAAIPTFQGVGTAKSGTGAVSPTWPTHQVSDVALLFVESTSGQVVTLSTAAGFVAVSNSPQYTSGGSTTSGTRITVFWVRATSTSMATPTVADAGDHVNAQILTYRGVVSTGNPWDVTGGGNKSTASSSINLPSVTTTMADTLIVQVSSKDLDSSSPGFSAETNVNLASIVERTDIGTQSGNGGGFAVWDGGKAVAGATGITTATVTSSVNAYLTIALKPPAISAANSTVVASPTSVAADNSTPSTITVTLKDGASNPVSGKTVTLAQSGGNSTITTISGTTNSSGVATFTVQDGTPEGPITYTASDTTDNITVTQTAQVTFTTATCFYDSFTGSGTPGTYWSLGVQSGSFTPQRVGNRLRLTDTGTSEATWVSLNKYFPGFGNKITAEFDHYAYGGSGADGIAMILSDAAIEPAAGAFGGSLGYAPKSNPGSDCTVTNGCVGFTGGWLGMALDEYGNFQNPTEGRYGGPGQVVESVSIRGSGSGMSGYRYITGTPTLSPTIDGNGSASPPYRYRMTIDHSDSVHAWVSVERDTTGGGTAYQTLIGATGCATTVTSSCLDIKDAGYSQNAVPTNWRLSFTGSSGAATNTHEIDTLKVCTTQNIATPTLDHIELDHTGQGCTGSGNPTRVTIKACADPACSALYPGSVTVNLNAVTNGTWSSDPVTFSGGSTTVALSDTSAGTVTLGGSATNPIASNPPTKCYVGTTNTCSFTFSSCVFDVVEATKSSFSPIYTKLASNAFSLDVISLSGSSQTVSKVEIVDASSGSCSAYTGLGNSTTTVPSNFTAGQRKPFAFNYANAVPNARIRVTSGSGTSCSSDNFAIRPVSFTLTSSASQTGSSGTPIFKAGTDTFSITATTLSSYAGAPKLDSSRISTALANSGTLSTASFPAATAGVTMANGFVYTEVGNFVLGVHTVYDDSFATVDSNKSPPECTSDFSNTANANGMFGCMFGNTATPTLGRFVPDHFGFAGAVQTRSDLPAGSSFTYMDEPMKLTLTVTAYNAGENVTRNYGGNFAKLDYPTLGTAANWFNTGCTTGSQCMGLGAVQASTGLSNRLSIDTTAAYGSSFPASSWVSGVGTFTLNSIFGRAASVDGPYDTLLLGGMPHDSDGVTLPGPASTDTSHRVDLDATTGNTLPSNPDGTNERKLFSTGFSTRMRFGRLRVVPGQCSPYAQCRLQVVTEYWNGSSWGVNTLDSATRLVASNVSVSWTGSGTSPTIASVGVVSSGYGSIVLNPPGPAGGFGRATVCAYLSNTDTTCNTATAAGMAYLMGNWNSLNPTGYAYNPSAQIYFGSPRPPSGLFYRRENF